MTVQPYSFIEHGETVQRWWESHTGRRFQHAMMPPCGVVGIDDEGPVAACWLYMSVGVGVAFIESPVSRPGLSIKQARDAFTTLLAALEVIALEHDYGAIVANTLPAIARTLKGLGFTFNDTPKLTGLKLLR